MGCWSADLEQHPLSIWLYLVWSQHSAENYNLPAISLYIEDRMLNLRPVVDEAGFDVCHETWLQFRVAYLLLLLLLWILNKAS